MIDLIFLNSVPVRHVYGGWNWWNCNHLLHVEMCACMSYCVSVVVSTYLQMWFAQISCNSQLEAQTKDQNSVLCFAGCPSALTRWVGIILTQCGKTFELTRNRGWDRGYFSGLIWSRSCTGISGFGSEVKGWGLKITWSAQTFRTFGFVFGDQLRPRDPKARGLKIRE